MNMEYEVGSIADLISGNVTPNRPKLVKRAFTPVKNKMSPNVTPKSQTIDRSVFLSPSLQKKKAIVKKSPKRIFQEDPNLTQNEDPVSVADKATKINQIKKHLESDLENTKPVDSPKKKKRKVLVNKEDEPPSKIKQKNNNSWIIEPTEHNDIIQTQEVVSIKRTKKIKTDKKNAINKKRKNKKSKEFVAMNDGSDSEHCSDDEIESENEQEVTDILEGKDNPASDSDSESEIKNNEKVNSSKDGREKIENFAEPDELKRTLFVGNVPFSKKCKKEMKKIFSQYGKIESVRIRNIPVKDVNTSQKLAFIKNEIHPDRSSVNVYIKFKDPQSVEMSLVENNRLMGEKHLRVDYSASTGEYHDPRKILFVGNLPLDIEEETFRSIFDKCGKIYSVRIVRDKKMQIGKGIGFVNFESADSVELALMMDEKDLTVKNRVLRLTRYKPNAPKKRQNKQTNVPAGGSEITGARKRLMNKASSGKNGRFDRNGPNDRETRNCERNKQGKGGFNRRKKEKQDFVGLAAEKKKKKFNRGQKKNKKLSEILTKGMK